MPITIYLITTPGGNRFMDTRSRSLIESEKEARTIFGNGCTVEKKTVRVKPLTKQKLT